MITKLVLHLRPDLKAEIIQEFRTTVEVVKNKTNTLYEVKPFKYDNTTLTHVEFQEGLNPQETTKMNRGNEYEIVIKDKKDVTIDSLYKENVGWTKFYYYSKDTLGLVEVPNILNTTFTKSKEYPNLNDTPAWFYFWKAIENTAIKEAGNTPKIESWSIMKSSDMALEERMKDPFWIWTRENTGKKTVKDDYLKGTWIGNKNRGIDIFLPTYNSNKSFFEIIKNHDSLINLNFTLKQLTQFNQLLEDFRTYAEKNIKKQWKITIKGSNYTIEEKSKDKWEDLGIFETVSYREEYSTNIILFINPRKFESRIDKIQKTIKKVVLKIKIFLKEDKERLSVAKKIRLRVNVGDEPYPLFVNDEETLFVYGKECDVEVSPTWYMSM